MLYNLGKWLLLQQKSIVSKRCMTTTEVSTALRPFYFAVHPDLFGQYPTERAINEDSLKQLSSFLECLQTKTFVSPCHLQFYLKDKSSIESTLRLITIHLNEKNIKSVVLTVLKSCNLSTEYVDGITKVTPTSSSRKYWDIGSDFIKTSKNIDYSKVENDPIFGAFIINNKIKEARDVITLDYWLQKNFQAALELKDMHKSLREDVARLQKVIVEKLKLVDVRWECGWNEQHLKGCLLSLKELTDQHPDVMHILKGRVVVFAQFTGVSLDGYIMLNSAEVRHNWLELIKNVEKYDAAFRRIPGFEKALSQILLNIQVVRRKFMPKILAGEYESNLQQITTLLGDFLSRRSYPSEWPKSLEDYKIVIETEAGPLMVSPTGLFIVPCSYPSVLLVKFISEHMLEASQRMIDYKRNKYVERALHKQCIEELQLESLHKDDNVTPDLMIQCCKQLLQHKNMLYNLHGVHLYITNYYSVLRDGVMCIPWNWSL